MQKIYFEDYADLACYASDRLDALKDVNDDDDRDVTIIAKYDDARNIISELIYLGYQIQSIDISSPEICGYDDELVISITNLFGEDEVWCEPFRREDGYINDESAVILVMDSCSSKVLPHCKGTVVIEAGICEDVCDDDGCCGCQCQCDCDEDNECDDVEYDVTSDDDGYSITVRYNIDADEAMKVIKDMEQRMEHMNDMFREMENFRKMFNW